MKLSSLRVLRIYQDAMSHSFSLRGCEKADRNQGEEKIVIQHEEKEREEEKRGGGGEEGGGGGGF